MESTENLIESILDILQFRITKISTNEDEKTRIEQTFKEIASPFEGINTEPLLNTFVKEKFNYVDYEVKLLGKTLKRKKINNKIALCEVNEEFIYIPVLDSLQQLLSNERISKMIFRPKTVRNEDIFYDVHDGSLFKNDNFFIGKKYALELVINHDDLEVCNPLGSKAGKHKVDMFYYSLVNIDPKFRSKHCAVRLLAICNTNFVKKYGIEKVLSPIVDDVNRLYEGYPMLLQEKEFSVFGKVVMCLGDTLGQHLWGGFKEGVGVSRQKCRHCYCEFDDMQGLFREELFVTRNKELYEQNCSEIKNAETRKNRQELETEYGINKRSYLNNFKEFDVTEQLPQDIMHTLLEGTVQYELRLLLLHYITSQEFTFSQLNDSIRSFYFPYSEVGDKFGPLSETVFYGNERYKLKYNAAQTRLFLRGIPFLLINKVDSGSEYYMFLIEIIKICNIVLAPVISENTIVILSDLIEIHLKRFKNLFPDVNITPKQHYTIHFPSQIRRLGPPVRASCFSFESAHNYFKELARKQNFKNLPLSLAKRHQKLECCNFINNHIAPESHPLFSTERKNGVVKLYDDVKTTNLQRKFNEAGLLPGVTLRNVYAVSWVIRYGTKYKRGATVAYGVDHETLLPSFGKIETVFLIHGFVYFEIYLYNTIRLNETFQSYETTQNLNKNPKIISYESLLDYNVYHVREIEGRTVGFIPIKYSLSDLIEQHINDNNPLFENFL